MTEIATRPAAPEDAPQMSALLAEILQSWGSPRPSDPAHIKAHYIAHPDSVACTVALGPEGEVIGFQSLRGVGAENPYDLPEGWAAIGTYVRQSGARRGVGRALFAASRAAAEAAGLTHIEAKIALDNARALAYYEAMGFRDYAEAPGAVRKSLRLSKT